MGGNLSPGLACFSKYGAITISRFTYFDKDYNDIFATVYYNLKMCGCINIFDRLENIISSRKPTPPKAEPTVLLWTPTPS